MPICGVAPAYGRSFVACALKRFGAQALLRRTAKYASHLRTSGAPANGISQGSTCICLPARSPASRSLAEGRRFGKGRALFEQPAKDHFPITLLVISDACIRQYLRL